MVTEVVERRPPIMGTTNTALNANLKDTRNPSYGLQVIF
jgi:hypothetical protein